jgi:hypothetical protein
MWKEILMKDNNAEMSKQQREEMSTDADITQLKLAIMVPTKGAMGRAEALGALDRLVARLEAAERERDARVPRSMMCDESCRRAVERAEVVEQERDRAVKEARAAVPLINRQRERAEAAEADAEQLRETFRVPGVPALLARAEAAEAALAEARREQDEWHEAAKIGQDAALAGAAKANRAAELNVIARAERDEARAALGELWDHIHPEPKMSGASVVTRTRIPPEIAGRVRIALAAAGETAPSEPETRVQRGGDGTGETFEAPSGQRSGESARVGDSGSLGAGGGAG